MRKQIFTVAITTKEKDGCGNEIKPLTEGDVRKALLQGLNDYDSISVSFGFDADIEEKLS